MPTQWRIRGAWRDTGEDVELVIDSPTATGAEATATNRGVLVSSCDPVASYVPRAVGVPKAVGGRSCPHCGATAVGRVRGLQGFGEIMTFMVLFFLLMIPGIVYYIYMESVPYCSGCGRRVT